MTRPSDFDAGVKVHNDTAGMAHKVHIGQTGQGLQETLLVLTNAGTPPTLKGLAQGVCHIAGEERLICTLGAEELGEVGTLVNFGIHLILRTDDLVNLLAPLCVNLVEQELDMEARNETALVANIVLVRLRVNPCGDT